MRVTRRGRLRVVHGGRPKTYTRQPGIWVTGTGERMAIAQMDVKHLCNSIFMMRRQWHTLMATVYASSDEPPTPLKRHLMQEESNGPGTMWPIYDELMAEARKRKVL